MHLRNSEAGHGGNRGPASESVVSQIDATEYSNRSPSLARLRRQHIEALSAFRDVGSDANRRIYELARAQAIRFKVWGRP